jgi:ketosteroid isomerase-like protein
MANDIEVIKQLYDQFNKRDIDSILAVLADNVEWANGMEGGYVHGHKGVRDYWTRQWAMVSPHVEPVQFTPSADGSTIVEVQQTIYDLNGNPIEQVQGLQNKTVMHVFHFQDGKVVRFDVQES